MFRKDFVLSVRGFKAVSTCLLLMTVMGGVTTWGQTMSPILWHNPYSGYEKGKISELKDKHRVYVSFFDVDVFELEPNRTGFRQRILNQLSRHKTLEVVENPESAELAIHISSSSGGVWDFFVLTRGAPRKDGRYTARVVVKKLRSDSRDSTQVIEQAVSTFVDDLRAVRGQK